MPIVSSDHQEQLVRGLTHRMNNILSLFHGYLGLLSEGRKLDPIVREGLARMREGAREATELMERTCAISRSSAGCMREVELSAFLQQLAPTFDSIRTPAVQVVTACDEDIPAVKIDASRLKLALTELVQNACEAEASKVTVRVTTETARQQEGISLATAAPESETRVVIEVSDDGHGIPQASEKQIFEPFFSTKKGQPSAGLGLAVALGCVRQFGGTIEHTRSASTTTFRITLPALVRQSLNAAA